jgi:hypothetical protein
MDVVPFLQWRKIASLPYLRRIKLIIMGCGVRNVLNVVFVKNNVLTQA